MYVPSASAANSSLLPEVYMIHAHVEQCTASQSHRVTTAVLYSSTEAVEYVEHYLATVLSFITNTCAQLSRQPLRVHVYLKVESSCCATVPLAR